MKDKVLVIGGTGAIGAPLVEVLKDTTYDVYVTSRKEHKTYGNLYYLKGNAHDKAFLASILEHDRFIAIYDFMVWKNEEFKDLLPLFLDATDQYFYLSSCRCFAESHNALTESSPKLLDVCCDKVFLASDDYALSKTRQEILLRNTGRNNWTIVRPYLTYSDQRLQLCIFEQNDWLLRAIKGKTIVFFEDLADKYTTLTYGVDVARILYKLLGEKNSFGEDFNITTGRCIKWGDVMKIYTDELNKLSGKCVSVKMYSSIYKIDWLVDKWKLKYDRGCNRMFNNQKLISVIGHYDFVDPEKGLRECINVLYSNPINTGWDIPRQAKFDQLTNEWAKYKEFSGLKEYLTYMKWRSLTPKIMNLILKTRKIVKSNKQ